MTTIPICSNCETPLDDYEYNNHRCMADEMSCLEGRDCPDYVEACGCECRKEDYVNQNKIVTLFRNEVDSEKWWEIIYTLGLSENDKYDMITLEVLGGRVEINQQARRVIPFRRL